jgi:hypothetical protein
LQDGQFIGFARFGLPSEATGNRHRFQEPGFGRDEVSFGFAPNQVLFPQSAGMSPVRTASDRPYSSDAIDGTSFATPLGGLAGFAG